jgi:hypothetical protein
MIEKEFIIDDKELMLLSHWYDLIKYIDATLLTEEDRKLKKRIKELLN